MAGGGGDETLTLAALPSPLHAQCPLCRQVCSFQDEQHHDELASTHMPASQPVVAADADADFPSLMGGQGGGSKRMSKRHASLRNVDDKSTTREEKPKMEAPSFGAHQWACSCCGFINRPQNNVCGGPNPRYGCKAPPGGTHRESATRNTPRFFKTRYCARWQKEGLADGQPCQWKTCTFAHGPSELGQEQKAPRVGGGVGGGARGRGGGEKEEHKEEHAAKISTSGNYLQRRSKGSGGGGRVPPPSTDTRTSRYSSSTVKSSLSYSSSLKLGRDGFGSTSCTPLPLGPDKYPQPHSSSAHSPAGSPPPLDTMDSDDDMDPMQMLRQLSMDMGIPDSPKQAPPPPAAAAYAPSHPSSGPPAKSYAPSHPSSGPPRSQRVSAKPYTPPQRRLVVASPYTYVPPSRRSNSAAAESANEGKGCNSQRIFSVARVDDAGAGGAGVPMQAKKKMTQKEQNNKKKGAAGLPAAEYCAICDKHVNRGQMTDHLGGKKHRAAANMGQ